MILNAAIRVTFDLIPSSGWHIGKWGTAKFGAGPGLVNIHVDAFDLSIAYGP